MRVLINGSPREVREGLSVAEMLRELGMGEQRVAVERNLDIIPRQRWGEVRVEEGDRFEIVHFVGGGR